MTLASALPLVSALPTVQPASPWPGPGQPLAADDGGFAQALHQARQRESRSHETAAQNKTTQKEGPKNCSAAPHERSPRTPLARGTPADAGADVDVDADAGADADTDADLDAGADVRSDSPAPAPPGEAADGTTAGLPPWLAQAVRRAPTASGDAAQTAGENAAMAGPGAATVDALRDAAAQTSATTSANTSTNAAARTSAAPTTDAPDGWAARAAKDGPAHSTAAFDPTPSRLTWRASGSSWGAAQAAEPAEPAQRLVPPTLRTEDHGGPGAAAPLPLQVMQAPGHPGFGVRAAGEAVALDRAIAAPVASPGFVPSLAAELTLLVKGGVTEARLHLNPADMGPITVQIAVDGQMARVEMAADNAATRQALEHAMPALAGALREDGLTLTGGGVYEQAHQPRHGAHEQTAARAGLPAAPGPAANGADADADADADAARSGLTGQPPATWVPGRIDLYA